MTSPSSSVPNLDDEAAQLPSNRVTDLTLFLAAFANTNSKTEHSVGCTCSVLPDRCADSYTSFDVGPHSSAHACPTTTTSSSNSRTTRWASSCLLLARTPDGTKIAYQFRGNGASEIIIWDVTLMKEIRALGVPTETRCCGGTWSTDGTLLGLIAQNGSAFQISNDVELTLLTLKVHLCLAHCFVERTCSKGGT